VDDLFRFLIIASFALNAKRNWAAIQEWHGINVALLMFVRRIQEQH
jgi:hypothetical protein